MEKNYLDTRNTLESIDQLCWRIKERFSGTELYHLARGLYDLGKETDAIVTRIEKPNRWLRLFTAFFIFFVVIGLFYALSNMKMDSATFGMAEFIQVIEAGLNDLVLLGAAIVFLVSIETRTKRKKVVEAINRLRAIAHAVDFYQLTKDPHCLVGQGGKRTSHSPKRKLTPYQLGRYLDYSSELLSLTGKIGFLYVQKFNDPVSVNAVNDLENLTTGLSRKIWQKIMLLNSSAPEEKQV